MKKQFVKEAIIRKVEKKELLTREEELFYLVEVLGIPADEAEIIMTINENKDKGLIID